MRFILTRISQINNFLVNQKQLIRIRQKVRVAQVFPAYIRDTWK